MSINLRDSRQSRQFVIAAWTRRLDFVLWIAVAGCFLGFTWGQETLAQRQARVEQMKPTEREQLRRKFERFRALPADEHQRLRQLDLALEQAPDGAELWRVMQAYHEWLGKLTQFQRARLQSAKSPERISEIAKLRLEESKRPTPQDRTALSKWWDEVNLARLDPAERKALKDKPEHIRRFTLYMNFWTTFQKAIESLTPADLARLRDLVSDKLRQQLDAATTLPEQQQLVMNWLKQSRSQGGNRWGGLPELNEESLSKFLDGIPKGQREELLNMPADEMRQQLFRRYFERMGGPRGQRGGDPNSDKPAN